MLTPLDAVGQVYKDFQITKYLSLKELSSSLVELLHIPSGAKVLHIANEDPENLFCLGFQTLPSSSNGVAHILEHTVLCGSKKFPIKDPFFSMAKRSLNTFMNAMTGQDTTFYPAASQVEKDFYNLLEVYLDAVFYPELKKLSFLQEGWRFQFATPDDPSSPLTYQGVVYNEMKGAMSSSSSRLWEILCKNLLPDLTYAHNSGGDPKDIPNLSYEELLDFHRTFYHPSRCLFFFYGNLELVKHLDFLSQNILDGVEKLPPLPPIPLQRRFQEPVHVVGSYPSLESNDKADIIALSWLTVPLTSQEEVLTLCLLDSLLMETDASPLKMALLKSGLCSQADASPDIEMSEVIWTIVCKGAQEKDKEKIKEFIFQTLEEIAKKPFSFEEIQASIHQMEFERKEIGAEGVPFGLTLYCRAAPLKQHGSEPENGLLIHQLFSSLRQKVKDPLYLSNFLKKHLLSNPHHVLVGLKADPNLEKQEKEEEKKRLEKIQKSLSQKEIEKILLETKELAKFQEEKEGLSLECLPKISLKEIPQKAKDYLLKKEEKGPFQIYHHNSFTNQIVYADLVLDLPDLKLEDLAPLSLFTRILTELGAGGKSYEEMLDLQQAEVGDFHASLHLDVGSDGILRPAFALKGKALFEKTDKLFSLFSDFLFSPDFSDKERIKELIDQQVSSLKTRLVGNSLKYASMESLKGNSLSSMMINELYGLPYFQKVLEWEKEIPDELFTSLERLKETILKGKSADLVLSCSDEAFKEISNKEFFGLTIPLSHPLTWKGSYPLPKRESLARWIPAPVAFTILGMKTITQSDPLSPFLLIATELLDNCYLHKEIREKGGAYGSGAVYTPLNGNFYLYSYRDPNLTKTQNSFERALEKTGEGYFSDEQLEEAKLSVLQTLDAPISAGSRGAVAYHWLKTNRTFEQRDAFRKKIILAQKEDVIKAIQSSLWDREKTLVTMIGKELFEKEKSSLPVVPIFNAPPASQEKN